VSVAGIDQVKPLSWEEFSRDLLLASWLTHDVSIFSLEGCVRQGYLEHLKDFDWSAPVAIPAAEAARIDRVRVLTRALLWALARPIPTLALIVFVFLAIRHRIPRIESERQSKESC
jgi:hypothetical protein